MSALTPELTVAFYAFMRAEFRVSVVPKANSFLMTAAADILAALDIQEREQFMRDFVSTLGRTVYAPFEVGVAGRWSLRSQVFVLVHECQHVAQLDRDGWAIYDSRYLASPSWRAGYEAEAYGAELELEFWRTGRILDIAARVDSLRYYGCKAEDIAQAHQTLLIRAGVVSAGVVETRSARAAIPWLEANVPGLRS